MPPELSIPVQHPPSISQTGPGIGPIRRSKPRDCRSPALCRAVWGRIRCRHRRRTDGLCPLPMIGARSSRFSKALGRYVADDLASIAYSGLSPFRCPADWPPSQCHRSIVLENRSCLSALGRVQSPSGTPYNVPVLGGSRGLKLMAGILRGGTCGGSRSSGSQDTRTYVPPTFAEATDVSEEIRERRADVGRSIALRVLAAVLIFSAIGIGFFPESAAIPVRAKSWRARPPVPSRASRAGRIRRPTRHSPQLGRTTSVSPNRGSR